MAAISDIHKKTPLEQEKEETVKKMLSEYAFSDNALERYEQYIAEGAHKGKRFAYYRNLSENDIDQKLDILLARKSCAGRAENFEGWSYVGSYIDQAYRYQRKFGDRPALRKLLDDARNGKIDLIVTDEIKRFTESVYKTVQLTEELRLMSPPVAVMFEKDWIDSEAIHDLLMTMS